MGGHWGSRALGAAVLASCLALPAWAAQWQRTFPVTGSAVLRLMTRQGGVRVNSWDQSQIQVNVSARGWQIGPGGVRVEARQAGGAVVVRVLTPRHEWGWADHDLHISVWVPRHTRLHLRSGDGDVTVDGVTGRIWLQSGDGNIVGSDLASGNLVAHSGDGNVRLSGRFASVQASSGDGDIRLRADAGSAVRGAWMLRTGDGNVSVVVPAGLAAEVDARTGDGDIHLPGEEERGNGNSHHVHRRLGGGGGLIALRSGDGWIRLQTQ
ncbi:MAG: DUF4097 family beta strand repeat-containing protein [Terriglobales bacterium]